MSKILSNKTVLAAVLFSLAIFAARGASAASVFDITFPIPELGGCADRLACKAYCDAPANADACQAFARDHGLNTRNNNQGNSGGNPSSNNGNNPRYNSGDNGNDNGRPDIDRAKAYAAISADGGPGQCGKSGGDPVDACGAYCGSTTHIQECVAYGKKHDLFSGQDLSQAEKVAQALAQGAVLPNGCTDQNSCRKICDNPNTVEQAKSCFAFAQKAGLLPPGVDPSMIEKRFEEMQNGGPMNYPPSGPNGGQFPNDRFPINGQGRGPNGGPMNYPMPGQMNNGQSSDQFQRGGPGGFPNNGPQSDFGNSDQYGNYPMPQRGQYYGPESGPSGNGPWNNGSGNFGSSTPNGPHPMPPTWQGQRQDKNGRWNNGPENFGSSTSHGNYPPPGQGQNMPPNFYPPRDRGQSGGPMNYPPPGVNGDQFPNNRFLMNGQNQGQNQGSSGAPMNYPMPGQMNGGQFPQGDQNFQMMPPQSGNTPPYQGFAPGQNGGYPPPPNSSSGSNTQFPPNNQFPTGQQPPQGTMIQPSTQQFPPPPVSNPSGAQPPPPSSSTQPPPAPTSPTSVNNARWGLGYFVANVLSAFAK